MSGLTLIGDHTRFAMAFQLVPDPDGVEPSWGRLQIWVGSRNLTYGLSATKQERNYAECPLLPIIEWLIESWDRLLHEERLPRAGKGNSSASWHVLSISELPAQEAAAEALLEDRETWWQHHGLGASLPGYRIPDLHFRRCGNDIELSWDDREWRSVPTGITLLERSGAATFSVEEVADVLEQFVQKALTALAAVPETSAVAARLQSQFDALATPRRRVARLVIGAGDLVRHAAEHLRNLTGGLQQSSDAVVASLLGTTEIDASPRRWTEFPTPVLLFRSASPNLSTLDVDAIASLCAEARGRSTDALEPYREHATCPRSPGEATQDGYERALELRAALDLDEALPLGGERDLEEVLLPRLEVVVRNIALQDRHVEALCFAGGGYGPTIAINERGVFSSTPWGRRMSLAHELCHLLFDCDRAGRTGVVSNPWSSPLEERRANAFAAMFLAPEPALRAVLPADPERWTRADLEDAMQQLGIGATTLLRHLRNLQWITAFESDRWLDVLVNRR